MLPMWDGILMGRFMKRLLWTIAACLLLCGAAIAAPSSLDPTESYGQGGMTFLGFVGTVFAMIVIGVVGSALSGD
jgi:hypothetical protein